MSVRLAYEQAIAGALAGWIGHDLAIRLAVDGPAGLSGSLVGSSIGFLVLVPAARRLEGGKAARILVAGTFAGGLAGAIGFGFPFGLFPIPQNLSVLIGALAVGLALGPVRWPGLTGIRAGMLGGLAGGAAMVAVSFTKIGPLAAADACLGAIMGLALALPGWIRDNSANAPFRNAGATG